MRDPRARDITWDVQEGRVCCKHPLNSAMVVRLSTGLPDAKGMLEMQRAILFGIGVPRPPAATAMLTNLCGE